MAAPSRFGLFVGVAIGVVAAVVLVMMFRGAAGPDHAPPETREAAEVDPGRPSSRGAIAPITGQAFTEDGASPESSPTAGRLEIEVIDPKGNPATGVRLVLFRGEKALTAGKTDAEGLAGFPSGSGEAKLFVIPPSSPELTLTVSIEPGRRRVELPRGVVLSGRVEVDGLPPRERDVMHFQPSVLSDSPPYAVYEALAGDHAQTYSIDASGTFEFAGLREGSEWQVYGTLGYERVEILAQGQPTNVITAPAANVLIRLHRVPVIRGRAVVGNPPMPAPLALCQANMTGPGPGGAQGAIGMRTDASGVFRFVATIMTPNPARSKPSRIEITLSSSTGSSARTVVLDPAPEHDLDLGDLLLSSPRVIRFVTSTPAGAPIAGAFARVPDAEKVDAASRTDESGAGAIEVAENQPAIIVGAVDHGVVQVPIPRDVQQPIPVVLSPTGTLAVTVTSKARDVTRSLGVRIEGDPDEIFAASPSVTVDPVYFAGGAGRAYLRTVGESNVVDFKLDGEGRVLIAGLLPGVPITVDAVDALGNVQATTQVTLSDGERKSIELRVAKEGRPFRGIVRDPTGAAVAGAVVSINSDPNEAGMRWPGPGSRIDGTTGADGRFTLTGFLTDRIHFGVNKPGFAPFVRRDFEVPSTETAITLQRGATLRVEVVDASGAAIPDLYAFANVSGYPEMSSTEKQPGAYVFDDMPLDTAVTVNIVWLKRGWTRSLVVKKDQTEVMKMPPTGSLRIDYTAIGDPPIEVTLVSKSAEPGTFVDWIPPPVPPGGRVYEIPVVVAGEYVVTLKSRSAADGGESLPENVTVPPGQSVAVTVRKP